MSGLEEKISKKEAIISVVGLGYVGLPLAVEFSKKGFKVQGVDVDETRISSLRRGKSYILDLGDEELKAVVKSGRFKMSRDYSLLKRSDVVIISVPTPLRKTGEPDLSCILDASRRIKRHLSRDTLLILESTTYPGTTEEIILPIFSEGGYRIGKDFYLAFSPERVDPGNKIYRTANIPKVVAGVTKRCLKLALSLYKKIVEEVIAVSSPRVAEMVKLLENSFRSVNIALANETALICHRLGIDVWEVIKAARSKPFGFMAFYPGPGIGGHCIPTDPMYLIWKARLSGYEPKLIRTAQEINFFMPQYVVERLSNELNSRARTLKNAKILVAGVTYKPDVNDIRESPALEIIQELSARGAKVYFYDPYIRELKLGEKKYPFLSWNKKNLARMDCVLIVTNHSCLNYQLLKSAQLVFDTRNTISWKGKNLLKL